MKQKIGKILILLLVAITAVLINKFGLLQRTLDWIEGFGAAGPAVFVLVYVLSCIFFVPSLIFTFSSGALFGVWAGFAFSLAGTAIGSTAAFLIGRYLACGWVEKAFAANNEFQKLARALEKKGWKIIMLARFSPVFPFMIGNYAFGVTRVRTVHYFLATLFGGIPSALLYSYLGFLFRDLSSFQSAGRERTPQEWALIAFGLAATVFLAWYLRKVAENTEKE